MQFLKTIALALITFPLGLFIGYSAHEDNAPVFNQPIENDLLRQEFRESKRKIERKIENVQKRKIERTTLALDTRQSTSRQAEDHVRDACPPCGSSEPVKTGAMALNSEIDSQLVPGIPTLPNSVIHVDEIIDYYEKSLRYINQLEIENKELKHQLTISNNLYLNEKAKIAKINGNSQLIWRVGSFSVGVGTGALIVALFK